MSSTATKKLIIHLLPLQLSILLIAIAGSACHITQTHPPLKAASVIIPVEYYTSSEDKQLATTYYENLKNIFNNVRARYKPQKLEFFLISGIGFHKIRIDTSFNTYLSLITKTSKRFYDGETTFEQRTSTIFKEYIKPLLKIAAQEKTILNDETLSGIAITIRWSVTKTLREKHHLSLFEQVSLVVQKEQVMDYLQKRLTDQELLNLSTLVSTNEGENPRLIKINL